jgi:Tat protein translocase TatB subunit
MIDIGLSKMALIGAVALVVIGPEKLPRVARTVGTLLGKAQRYVSDVKAEVNRSMELDELRKMKDTVETAARDVEKSVHETSSAWKRTGARPPTSTVTAAATARAPPMTATAPSPRCTSTRARTGASSAGRAPVVQGPLRRAHQGAVGAARVARSGRSAFTDTAQACLQGRQPLGGDRPVFVSGHPACMAGDVRYISHHVRNLREDELAGTEQPFVQHLMELRDRLLYCIYGIALAVAVLAIWPGPNGLIDFIAHPIKMHMPPDAKLIAVGVFSPFFVPLKVLMMVAVLAVLPWIMYQIWAFVARACTAMKRSLPCR